MEMWSVKNLVRVCAVCSMLAACSDAAPSSGVPGADASTGADVVATPSGNSAMGTVGATTVAISGSGVGQLQNMNRLLGVLVSTRSIACGSTVIGSDAPYFRLHVGVSTGALQPGTYDGSAGVLEAYVESFPNPCRSTRVNPIAKNDGVLARSVTLTTLTTTRAAGTFRIRMYSPDQRQGDVTGSFDVPLCPAGASARCQ